MGKLIFYFCLHLFIILSSSIYLAFSGYYKTRKINSSVSIPIITPLYNLYSTNVVAPYLIITGINTGYGFYGMNVATQKFFTVDIFSKSGQLLYSDDRFGLKTLNASTRFETFPTKISNFIVETDDIKRNNFASDSTRIRLREEYVMKVAKYLGKYIAMRVEGAHHYRVTLSALIPLNIWSNEQFTTNKVFPQKVFEFSI